MKWTPILGCAALFAAVGSPVSAETNPQIYSYAVTHPVYGAIGTYDRSSDEADGATRARARLRIVVRVLGVVVRRETADQTEVWRGHRLTSFESLTSTNGKRAAISGEARGNRFVVTSPSGTETAPADVVASDPWSLNRMGSGTVVSTRTGKIVSVEVTGGEPETITRHGVSEPVRHYHVNTAARPNKWEVWINPRGVPIKFRSLETGGAIDFTLVTSPQASGSLAERRGAGAEPVKLRPARKGAAVALCIGVAGLTACASVPTVSPTVGQAASAEKPQILGSRGPLTTAQVKAKVAQLSISPGDNGLLQRHLAIEQTVAESPLIAGETTHLLRDGVVTFRAMFAAIRSAKHSVNLEYFIFEDVESDGVKLGDLLLAKRQEGVAVNVIYDSFGSSDTPKEFFERLRQAGANVVEFNPLNPLKAKKGYSPNDRDHRKILVVDGATAIVGGVNLSTTYQANPAGKSGAIPGEPAAHWRDTDLQIDGPAVAQLQTLFQTHWREQHGPPVDEAGWFPVVPPAGPAVVRILGSSPDLKAPRYYVTVISAIRSAEKSISASAAYFVPTHDEMEALTEAARRGVDVRLLLPDRSDSANSIALAHAHYADLLEAGVKIYETHDLVLHSKTVVVDGVWSAIGSSNFDHRSVIFNDEVDAVVLGAETAGELEAMAEDDRASAHPIDRKSWSRRPLSARAKEVYARIWEKWL